MLNNSPFSINFKKYADLTLEEKLKKINDLKIQIKETKLKHPERQPKKKEYWMNRGYSEEDSIKKISELQHTFSKEKCIEKFGEKDGLSIWKARQDKWQKTIKSKSPEEIREINKKKVMTLESLILKYGEEEGTQRYIETNKKRGYKSSKQFYIDTYGDLGEQLYNQRLSKRCTKNYSKISQKLFWNIYNKITKNLQDETYFAELNTEYHLFVNNGVEKIYSYDFVLKNTKKCIEFNGVYWHAKPGIYTENSIITKKTRAIDIWDKDTRKNNFIKDKGFDLLIIWEDEYILNPNFIVKKCVEFLNEQI